MRPLWILPPDLPELRAPRPGDGLAARPHLPDARRRRRADLDVVLFRESLRHVPRLHGLRDRVPLGRPLRAARRADARDDRALARTARRRAVVPAAAVQRAA